MSRPASETHGFIALEGGDSRIEVVPSLGGRVRSLHLFGREWLLEGDAASHPRAGRSPLAAAGWDECAPSLGGGAMPDWVKGVGGRALTIGGEARLQVPETRLHTEPDGHHLTCIWRGERMPWVLSRTLLVRPDGAVEARYEALTTGPDRLPFLWSAQLLFALTARTRLRLPDGGRLRIASLAGATMEGEVMEGEGTWPRLRLDGKSRDLSTPWAVPRRTQLNAWLDLPSARSVIQLWQDDARLTLSTDGAGVPYCGVMIDRSGAQRTRERTLAFRRAAVPTLALTPSLGAPDRYSEALGAWQSMTWLVPGEPRRWTMAIRAGT
ncbi:MAG: hypothetical protein WD771_05650 [Gemmatimonadaceae bacterium]